MLRFSFSQVPRAIYSVHLTFTENFYGILYKWNQKGINRNLGGFSDNELRNVKGNDLIAVELFASSYRKPPMG